MEQVAVNLPGAEAALWAHCSTPR